MAARGARGVLAGNARPGIQGCPTKEPISPWPPHQGCSAAHKGPQQAGDQQLGPPGRAWEPVPLRAANGMEERPQFPLEEVGTKQS